jgi:hypothetical protein
MFAGPHVASSDPPCPHRHLSGSLRRNLLRQTTHFVSRFKWITYVQPSTLKYSTFFFSEDDIL